jgi:hypothetical protein
MDLADRTTEVFSSSPILNWDVRITTDFLNCTLLGTICFEMLTEEKPEKSSKMFNQDFCSNCLASQKNIVTCEDDSINTTMNSGN